MTEKDEVTIIDSTAKEIVTHKRFYRSTTDRAVAGVAGGLGEFFAVDPGIVRLAWMAAGIVTLGIAVLIYTIMALAIPKEPPEYAAAKVVPNGDLWLRLKRHPILLWGSMLVLIGIVLLLNSLGILPWRLQAIWSGFWSLALPALVIGGGIYLVLVYQGKAPDPRRLARSAGDFRRAGAGLPLRRSRYDRQLAGVCGGVAAYFDIDSLVVRMVWVLLTVASAGILGIVLYGLAVLLVPVEE